MNIKKLTTQVVIAGAGPGGATASFFLTKLGIPHIVIEKAVFPRDKVCGDACSKRAITTLRRANNAWADELLENATRYQPCMGISFISPDGTALNVPFIKSGSRDTVSDVFVARRFDFDNFLFSKMPSPYCAIYEGAALTALETNPGDARVKFVQNGTEYEITCEVIMGADGDKSIVRKELLNEGKNTKANSVGLRAYYEGVGDMHPGNYLELHFIPGLLPCYFWIFPLPGHTANVGVGILSDALKKDKINLREVMVDAIATHPRLAHRFRNARLTSPIQGWGLPLAMTWQPLSGHRFMLVGDAGGLVDPFSGEGIGNAMYSGMIAATAIGEAVKKGEFTKTCLKTEYDDLFYKCLGTELKMNVLLLQCSRRQWLMNLITRKANKSATLADAINTIFSCSDQPLPLNKLSFYLKILLNK